MKKGMKLQDGIEEVEMEIESGVEIRAAEGWILGEKAWTNTSKHSTILLPCQLILYVSTSFECGAGYRLAIQVLPRRGIRTTGYRGREIG